MPLAIPTDTDGLEEFLNDSTKLAELIENKDGKITPRSEFATFVKNYATTIAAKDPGIVEAIRSQVQTVTAEFLRNAEKTGARPMADADPERMLPFVKGSSRYAAMYNRAAPGGGLDSEFTSQKGQADFLRAIFHKNQANGRFAAERERIMSVQNSFGSNVPADGGFLIPERLRADLLRVSLESAIVRSRARVIPMETLTVPYPTVDSTSNVSSVFGGIIGYWTEESGLLTQSQARFGRVMLTARKLTAYTEVPNELFADSIISLQAFINEAFPEAIAWFEDIAFLTGNGTGQPLGVLSAAARVSRAAESGQAASTLLWENIVGMYSRMLPSSLGRAVWVANIDTFPELATMALSVGTGGSAIWINNGVSGPPATILGRPVIFTEKVPGLGTVGDLNFIDFGYYLIGDRQVIQAETSPHYKFANDQTAMRFIERVDGQPWLQSAITPANGTNTLSPFVQMGARP